MFQLTIFQVCVCVSGDVMCVSLRHSWLDRKVLMHFLPPNRITSQQLTWITNETRSNAITWSSLVNDKNCSDAVNRRYFHVSCIYLWTGSSFVNNWSSWRINQPYEGVWKSKRLTVRKEVNIRGKWWMSNASHLMLVFLPLLPSLVSSTFLANTLIYPVASRNSFPSPIIPINSLSLRLCFLPTRLALSSQSLDKLLVCNEQALHICPGTWSDVT